MSYNELLDAAKGGSAAAKCKLAEMHVLGAEVEFSRERAFAFAKEAYSEGCMDAAHILFESYAFGLGAEENSSLAKKIAETAAAAGDKYKGPLGVYYSFGIDGDPDPEKALFNLEKAAAENSAYALTYLAKMYLLGNRVYKNFDKAAEYIKRLYDIGAPEAFALDGKRYYEGLGVDKDLRVAEELFGKAVKAGVADGYVGLALSKMIKVGKGADTEEGKALLLEAERRGSADAAIYLYNLERYGFAKPDATSYPRTDVFTKRESILKWADACEPRCLYLKGLWLPDGEERRKLWLKAARHGSRHALNNMVRYYNENVNSGTSIGPRDRDAAIELCNIGIRLCVDGAYSLMALLYSIWDKPRELEYYRLGAEAGEGASSKEYAIYLLTDRYEYWSGKSRVDPKDIPSPTDSDRQKAIELLIRALTMDVENTNGFMSSQFKFVPDERKDEVAKIIYDYNIRMYSTQFREIEGDFSYRIDFTDGARKLSKYLGRDKKVVIPEGVKEIDQYAFDAYCPVEEIICPKSVKFISQSAFSGMRKLKRIKLPKGIKDIQSGTFEDCVSLESIEIPTSVKLIDSSAFRGCSSLTEVYIPDSVKEIYFEAFCRCEKLSNVRIPDSLESITDVFRDSPLFKYNEYGGVKYIPSENNPYLAAVDIIDPPKKLVYHPDTRIIAHHVNLTDPDYRFDGVEEIELPKNVVFIAADSLQFKNVKSITLPPFKKLGRWLCWGHYEEIIVSPGTEAIEFECLWYGGDKRCHIWLPEGVKKLEKGCFHGYNLTIHAPEGMRVTKTTYASRSGQASKNKLEYYTPDESPYKSGKFTIPEEKPIAAPTADTPKAEAPKPKAEPKPKTAPKPKAEAKPAPKPKPAPSPIIFDEPSSPKLVSPSPAKEKPIEKAPTPKSENKDKAESEAEQLKKKFVIESGVLTRYSGGGGSVEIPNTVKVIGNYAFDSRADVREVIIPDSVTEIAGNAFSNCLGLTSIFIPRTVTYIDKDAFRGSKNLKTISVFKGTKCHKTAFKGTKLFAVKKYK